MNHKHIKHITNTHYRRLNKHLEEVHKSFDIEVLHQFRVEFKKLRAFFRYLAQLPGKEIKISKKLRKVYHLSGSIRDLQLQQQRILEATKQELKQPQEYLHLLRKEIDTLEQELSEIISEKPVKHSKKKTDRLLPRNFPLRGFYAVMQLNWNAINAIIASGDFSDDNIHSIRKILKDLFYNLSTYEQEENEILSQSIWKGKEEKYFHQLLTELGNYQDVRSGIDLINNYLHERLNKANRDILAIVKKTWLRDKVNMKKALVKKLKTDIAEINTGPQKIKKM